MIEEKRLIDSNMLIYAFDIFEKEKHVLAKKIFEKIFNSELSINLSTQNLSEFYVIITKKIKQPISLKEAGEIVSDLISLQNVTINTIKPATISHAIDISEKYSIHYWDALIAAVMYENNIFTIITENTEDFNKIPWIKAVNPFTKENAN